MIVTVKNETTTMYRVVLTLFSTFFLLSHDDPLEHNRNILALAASQFSISTLARDNIQSLHT